ncbi:MAG: PAS domain-containing protein [Deltaproteobacteria bacterium]|nr:PAS domain-containing protein [Deltaproteobacteria bacterium]
MHGLSGPLPASGERPGATHRTALEVTPEPLFDRLVELAALSAGAPVALLELVEANGVVVKACFGAPLAPLQRSLAPVATTNTPRSVPDAREDAELRDHPFVAGAPNVRAVACAALVDVEGQRLGALITCDLQPRAFDERQLRALALVAEQVQQFLRERRALTRALERELRPVLLLDGVGRVLAASPSALALLPGESPVTELLPVEVVKALRAQQLGGAAYEAVPLTIGARKLFAQLEPVAGGAFVVLRSDDAAAYELNQLRRERALFFALVDGSQDAIFAKDLQGRYMLLNDAAARELGRPRAEVLGRTDHELLPAELAGTRVARDLAVIGAGRTVTYEDTERPGRDAQTWLVNQGVLREPGGRVQGVFGIARDITDRKRVERELELGEERLRLAMSAGRLGAWELEIDNREITLSGATRELVGLAATARLDAVVLEALVHNEDRRRVVASVRAAIRDATELQVEFRMRHGGRGERWFHARGRPISDAVGHVTRLVGVVSDVTAQKEQEQHVSRVSRFQEQLLGIVSHDLRNPLSAIRVWAANAAVEAQTPRAQRAADRIAHSAQRMDRMIGDLLDFTRARLGGGLPVTLAEADLREICAHVSDELGAAHPGRLRLTTWGSAEGHWDSSRLAQVVSNLVGNALVHSPAESPVEVTVRGGDDEVEVEVHNDGVPIPAELQPILFEPFRRGADASRRSANLGLGLYISRELVKAHGGELYVRSDEGHGTTFIMRLPRKKP